MSKLMAAGRGLGNGVDLDGQRVANYARHFEIEPQACCNHHLGLELTFLPEADAIRGQRHSKYASDPAELRHPVDGPNRHIVRIEGHHRVSQGYHGCVLLLDDGTPVPTYQTAKHAQVESMPTHPSQSGGARL